MTLSPPPAPAGALRVATWNLWWRFGPDPDARHRAIAEVLRRVEPDVVCVQEVHGDADGADRAHDLAAALGAEVARSEPKEFRGESFGNAVLSRHPIVEHGEIALPLADGTPGFRNATWARLATPAGVLPVITTHLAFRFDESELRQRQVTALLTLAAELRDEAEDAPPVLLTGDLNAVPDSDEIRLLTGRRAAPVPGIVFTDAWPQVSEDPGHTWDRIVPYLADAAWPQRRLDYVMVSWPRPKPLGNPIQAFLIGGEPVDGVWPSDHLGVVVDLVGDRPA